VIAFFDAQPTTRKTPPLPSHVYFSLPPTPETVARAVCCAACCAGFGAPGLWFSSRITLLGFRRARTAEIQPRVHVARLRNTPRLHSARIYIFRFSWMIAARRWLPSEKGVARARAPAQSGANGATGLLWLAKGWREAPRCRGGRSFTRPCLPRRRPVRSACAEKQLRQASYFFSWSRPFIRRSTRGGKPLSLCVHTQTHTHTGTLLSGATEYGHSVVAANSETSS
jgi:hypothetical protein